MPFFAFFQRFFSSFSLGDVVGYMNHLAGGTGFILNRKGRYFHNHFMTVRMFVDVLDRTFLAGLFGFEHRALMMGWCAHVRKAVGQFVAPLADHLLAGQSHLSHKRLIGIDNAAAVHFDDRNGIRYAVDNGFDEIFLLANGILLFP